MELQCRKEEEEEEEEEYAKAVSAIRKASFVLIAAGAGFSADSGLPTYQRSGYDRHNLTYAEVCRPIWVHEDPALFYDFWESCTLQYSNTESHEGYAIVKKLLEQKRKECRKPGIEIDKKIASQPLFKTYRPDEIPSCTYIYTSNVDGHFRRIAQYGVDMAEIHGSVCEWQCAEPCSEQMWKLEDEQIQQSLFSDYMSPTPPFSLCGPSSSTAPSQRSFDRRRCPRCKVQPIRPHVMMFGDDRCIITSDMHARYQTWECAMENVLRENPQFRLVILEIGCGVRVPSVREECESVLRDINARSRAAKHVANVQNQQNVGENEAEEQDQAPQATLIRINPDFPEYTGEWSNQVISIQDSALVALRKIHSLLFA
eukprot:ANDGO_02655.mRNA.1 hypothetical protein SDRG_01321